MDGAPDIAPEVRDAKNCNGEDSPKANDGEDATEVDSPREAVMGKTLA